MRRSSRGHGFGHAWQYCESGHDTAESTQLAGIQFKTALDQDHGERCFSVNNKMTTKNQSKSFRKTFSKNDESALILIDQFKVFFSSRIDNKK